jgi:hypothetical protein
MINVFGIFFCLLIPLALLLLLVFVEGGVFTLPILMSWLLLVLVNGSFILLRFAFGIVFGLSITADAIFIILIYFYIIVY